MLRPNGVPEMRITEIQRFCMHDGPGVRTVVFFKGCPLNCAWCHNPETKNPGQELLFYEKKCIGCGGCAAVCPKGAHSFDVTHLFDRESCAGCGSCADICPTGALSLSMREMTVEEVLSAAEKDRAFYGSEGGITLSGGEPLAQPAAVLALLKQCREKGIGTAIETCGYFDGKILSELVPLTDLFLWDLKIGDEELHRKYTGVSNRRIIDNLLKADELGAETVLRCIMVKNVNMNEEHYAAVAEVWNRLKHCRYAELLPYHAYGGSKMLPLGLADNGRTDWAPDEEEIARAKEILQQKGVRVK